MAEGLAESIKLNAMTYTDAMDTINVAVLRNFPGYGSARQEKIVDKIENILSEKVDELIEPIFSYEIKKQEITQAENLINQIGIFLSGHGITSSSTGYGIMFAGMPNDPAWIRIHPILKNNKIWAHIDDLGSNFTALLRDTNLGMNISKNSKINLLGEAGAASFLARHGQENKLSMTKSGRFTLMAGPVSYGQTEAVELGKLIIRATMAMISAREACVFSLNRFAAIPQPNTEIENDIPDLNLKDIEIGN